jgi:ribosomal protein S8
VVKTDKMTVEESVEKIMNYLKERGYINKWKGESTLKETVDIK